MNARERLFAALNGEPTDRTPIWLLFPYHPTGYYVDVRNHPLYRPVFEASKQYAIMLNRRNLSAGPLHPDVKWSQERFSEDGVTVDRTIVEYHGRRLSGERRVSGTETAIRKLVTTDEDLEFFCSLPVNDDPAAIAAALDAQLPKYLAEREEFSLEYGAMMLDLGEPIGLLYHNVDLEQFSIWSLTHGDLIDAFLQRLQGSFRHLYRYCLERRLADVYFMVGSELAAPPLVGPDTFRRWIVPHAQELIAMSHAAGAKVIQHFHGQVRHLLPDFLEMGADALHTIEAPPVGNCTWAQAWEAVGDRMALIGNIQYDEFRSLTPAQMTRRVAEVRDACRGRRLILSPTAGPFDPNPPAQLIENYLAFMKAGWEYR